MYFGMHNHDEFSNITTGLDSMNKLSKLIETAQEFGLSGIAITNHDNLSEAININREQKRLRKEGSDFVLAIGNEIYLIDEYIDDDSVKQIYYHFILVAKDKIGYDALVQLSSKAWYRSSILRGKRRVPTEKADVEEIMTWAKGHLVATTACLGGELAKRVLANELYEATLFYDWCIEQFGEEDFFIELQPSKIPDQIKYNKRVTTLFPNAKFTIATDTHYLLEEDFPIFEAFLRSDEKNKKREVKEFYDYARLMKEEEIFSLMKEMGFKDDFIRECLDNTLKVQQQIEFYDLAQKQIIPKIPLKDIELILTEAQLEEVNKYPTLSWGLAADDVGTRYCTQYCLNSMTIKGLWDTAHLERLEEEFEVHKFQSEQLESNFFNYVNVMQWVINLSWSIDCAVGPSRGSASGCLLNYLMDVVQNDPLKYGLPFFRYLHKERVTPLDIDTDFQRSKRPALFAAIREQRGELGLTQVAAYRTLTLKAAIATAGRGYRSEEFPKGLDSDITRYLSSLIEIRRGIVATLKQTLYGDETTGYTKNTTFINECNLYKGLLDIIIAVEGLVVGTSTHAAAVILFDEQDRIFDHCSLMRAPNGDLCTSLDLHTVEEAG